jgi:predicted dehydrogenase
MVGHTFLYNNVVEDVRNRIVGGDLGNVLYLYGQRLNLGRLRADADVVWSLAPHDVSIANYWLDSKPHQVSARGIVCVNHQTSLAEVAFVQLDYPDGRTAHFHMSLLDPQKKRQMVVVGSEKMLVYDDVDIDRHIQIFDKRIEMDFGGPSPDLATFKAKSRAGDLVIPNIRLKEPLAVEMDHFLDCVRSGARPRTDGRHGVEVMAILEALSQSMAANGAVTPVDYPEF